MRRYNNPISATVSAILDRLRTPRDIDPLAPDLRLDGRTALVTGANSGLGKATAIALASRGARVIMACRGGIPSAGDAVRRASGSEDIEMVRVDLTDLDSMHALCDTLRGRRVILDTVVLNAGLAARNARPTRHGFETMFAVNYLAKVVLLTRLLGDGTIPNRVFASSPRGQDGRRPRVVLVSSEAHRSARAIDLARLGEFEPFGIRRSLSEYGHSKLLLCTFATELARRLSPGGEVEVGVHALCPGPVHSNMAREAPIWAKPILMPLMRLLFRSPARACEPVLFLATAEALEGETGTYLHMLRRKRPREDALDPLVGSALWEATEALLRRARRGEHPTPSSPSPSTSESSPTPRLAPESPEHNAGREWDASVNQEPDE